MADLNVSILDLIAKGIVDAIQNELAQIGW